MPDPRFTTTRWSLIEGTATLDDVRRQGALEELCGAYWYPLYAYLRRRGRDADRAADLVQGLFAKLLAGEAFANVERGRGRFRSWLLTALQNHERDALDHEGAQRRGGGRVHLSIDPEEGERRLELEDEGAVDPEAAFERAWAETVLGRARTALEAEWIARGRRAEFDVLARTLEDPDASRADLADQLGVSPVALRVAVHRLRRRFRELIGEAVQQTLGDDVPPESELEALADALRSRGAGGAFSDSP